MGPLTSTEALADTTVHIVLYAGISLFGAPTLTGPPRGRTVRAPLNPPLTVTDIEIL